MSLDFSVRDVADHETVTTHPHPDPITGQTRWHPVTETLVWWSIPCGTPEITAKNFEEVWRRVKIWQEATEAPIQSSDGPIYLTRADVHAHVGLRTNATSRTPAEFNKFVAETLYRRRERQEESALDTVGVPE